ncbi:MAG: OmpW family outer membrane protein, partial [Xanthomonadales bacterium]
MKRWQIGLAAAAMVCTVAPYTAVAEEGDWLFRAGWSVIDPKSDNLALPDVAPDAMLQVDKDARFTFDITYMFRDNWGVELLASDEWNHGFYVE